MKTAVLLNTHFIDNLIVERYNALKSGLLENMDLFILFNNENKTKMTCPAGWNIFEYSSEDLILSGYKIMTPVSPTDKRGTMWWNGSLMPINLFYLNHKEYDYIWSIEYDVFFNGDWKVFFEYFKNIDADFITSKYNDIDSGWWWYNYLYLPENKNDYFKDPFDRKNSFNVICRFSKSSMEFLDKVYKAGYFGNCEQTVPSALHNAKDKKFKIFELNGSGFSDEVTNNWKQEYTAIDKKNWIYHPVK